MAHCQVQLTEIARKAKMTYDKNENLKIVTKPKQGLKPGELEWVNHECAAICSMFWIRFTMITNTRVSGGETHNHDDLTQLFAALVEVRQALFDLYECISQLNANLKKMLALRVANVSWLKVEILDPLLQLKDQMALKVNQAKNRTTAHGTVESRRQKMQSGEVHLNCSVTLEAPLLTLEERLSSLDYIPSGKDLKFKLMNLAPELKDVRGAVATMKLTDTESDLAELMLMEMIGHACMQVWDSDMDIANVKTIVAKLSPAWATARGLAWSTLRQHFSLDISDTVNPLTPTKITLMKHGTEKTLDEKMQLRRQGTEQPSDHNDMAPPQLDHAPSLGPPSLMGGPSLFMGRASLNGSSSFHGNPGAPSLTGPPPLTGSSSFTGPPPLGAPALTHQATEVVAAAPVAAPPRERKYVVGNHNGMTFWYNNITKESTWIKPDDFEQDQAS